MLLPSLQPDLMLLIVLVVVAATNSNSKQSAEGYCWESMRNMTMEIKQKEDWLQ
jgi:hypothetical protein